MTIDQVKGVLRIFRANYPATYKHMDTSEQQAMIDLWYAMFKDDDARKVNDAVLAWIATDTKGFPPEVGKIKKKMLDMNRPNGEQIAQAWQDVLTCIRSFVHYDKYDKPMYEQTLSPRIKAVISYEEVKDLSMRSSETVLRAESEFKKEYQRVAEKEDEELLTGNTVKKIE